MKGDRPPAGWGKPPTTALLPSHDDFAQRQEIQAKRAGIYAVCRTAPNCKSGIPHGELRLLYPTQADSDAVRIKGSNKIPNRSSLPPTSLTSPPNGQEVREVARALSGTLLQQLQHRGHGEVLAARGLLQLGHQTHGGLTRHASARHARRARRAGTTGLTRSDTGETSVEVHSQTSRQPDIRAARQDSQPASQDSQPASQPDRQAGRQTDKTAAGQPTSQPASQTDR